MGTKQQTVIDAASCYAYGTPGDPEVIRRFGVLKELTPLRCFFRGDATVKAGDIYAPNGLLNKIQPPSKIGKGHPAIGTVIRWNRTWYRRKHVARRARMSGQPKS